MKRVWATSLWHAMWQCSSSTFQSWPTLSPCTSTPLSGLSTCLRMPSRRYYTASTHRPHIKLLLIQIIPIYDSVQHIAGPPSVPPLPPSCTFMTSWAMDSSQEPLFQGWNILVCACLSAWRRVPCLCNGLYKTKPSRLVTIFDVVSNSLRCGAGSAL